jgi:hypothetical protein
MKNFVVESGDFIATSGIYRTIPAERELQSKDIPLTF